MTGRRHHPRLSLSAVAAAMGPGRYARLRAGVAFAKGLATGWGVPFIGVRSVAAVAHAAGGHVGPIVIPAGRGRVYCWTGEPGEPLSPRGRCERARRAPWTRSLSRR